MANAEHDAMFIAVLCVLAEHQQLTGLRHQRRGAVAARAVHDVMPFRLFNTYPFSLRELFLSQFSRRRESNPNLLRFIWSHAHRAGIEVVIVIQAPLPIILPDSFK